MLTKGDTVLIIDAKYYTHTMQTQYDVHTLHSGNLYQIFTCVKNKDVEFGDKPHTVSGSCNGRGHSAGQQLPNKR